MVHVRSIAKLFWDIMEMVTNIELCLRLLFLEYVPIFASMQDDADEEAEGEEKEEERVKLMILQCRIDVNIGSSC